MLVHLKKPDHAAMASRWRRRRPCTILAHGSYPAALLEISGRGALIETGAGIALGTPVTLIHPEAGKIAGTIDAIAREGLHIAFEPGESAMAFALAAITADMSDPAY
jgi:hypothetical protein